MSNNDSIKSLLQNLLSEKYNLDPFDPKSIALTTLLEEALNTIMLTEREIYLNNIHQSSGNDKGNGFFPRSLATAMGNLSLLVPRVRSGQFRPLILPPLYQRTHASYTNLLEALTKSGYSDANMEEFFKYLNLPYSKNDINKIKDDLIQTLHDFKTQQLPSNLFAVFIDAYHSEMKVKDRVRKMAIFVIIAITLEGKKIPLGFYTMEGSESKEKWIVIFNDLINRGFKRALIIISDDFPGLDNAINTLFPNADHQLCFVHLQRNVNKNMGNDDAKHFNHDLKKIRLSALDFDSAVDEFLALCNKYQNKYPTFIS